MKDLEQILDKVQRRNRGLKKEQRFKEGTEVYICAEIEEYCKNVI